MRKKALTHRKKSLTLEKKKALAFLSREKGKGSKT